MSIVHIEPEKQALRLIFRHHGFHGVDVPRAIGKLNGVQCLTAGTIPFEVSPHRDHVTVGANGQHQIVAAATAAAGRDITGVNTGKEAQHIVAPGNGIAVVNGGVAVAGTEQVGVVTDATAQIVPEVLE